MRNAKFFIFIVFILFFGKAACAETTSLSFFPGEVIQGEPLMIQVNATSTVTLKKITFDGKTIGLFTYNDKPTALVGIDLNKKPGNYEAVAEFSDGSIIRSTVTVGERKKIEKPLGIPQKLGGDTVQSQNNLVSTLAAENKTLANIRTGVHAFWTSNFIPPLRQIIVTDPYGYSRQTGAYSIPHKGVDYRAKEGTEVTAINRGVIRIVKTYIDYGKTIVVDHGLGVMSFYLHLSKIKVKEGQLVQSGQVIGLSGQTGYADAPHLHLSVRISGVSIDPVKFLALFQ